MALAEAGHRVIVFESSTELGEIGAGIQVTPNLTRILTRWGLGAQLRKHGVQPPYIRQVRWSNSKCLTKFPVNAGDKMKNSYGSEYFHIHRNDLHRMLLGRARELGVTVFIGKTVVSYEYLQSGSKRDQVTLKDGSKHVADLIIAADGIRSTLSSYVVGEPVQSSPTGDSAYRALLTKEQMAHPELADLELSTYATSWIGPNRHIVGYYVSGGDYYNLVVIVPDEQAGEESWKLRGDMGKLRSQFEDWDPRIRLMLSMIDKSFIWKLRDRPALKRWVHPRGNLVLLGDAAHPMLPYIAQGAASAAEDAVALVACLKYATKQGSIRDVLKVYEALRLPRTQAMRDKAQANREYYHYPDGEHPTSFPHV